MDNATLKIWEYKWETSNRNDGTESFIDEMRNSMEVLTSRESLDRELITLPDGRIWKRGLK